VSVIRDGRWHAGVYVNHATVRRWTEEEAALVRDVAEQTWDAVERARRHAGAARVTFEAGVITAAALCVIANALDPRVLPQTWQGVAALTAMALISHAGGQGLLAVALGRLPSVFSSLVIFLEAVAAAIFGWILLGEALTLVQALGGALILFGIWTARPRGKAPVG